MLQNHFRTFWLSILLLLCITNFTGCASTTASRFYNGPTLPRKEVAYIISGNFTSIYISSITDKRDNKTTPLHNYSLELLPGRYTISFNFAYFKNTAGPVTLDLDVLPGGAYIAYNQFDYQMSTWRPILVPYEDYDKQKCEQASNGYGFGCADKTGIQEAITRYFQESDRSVVVPMN